MWHEALDMDGLRRKQSTRDRASVRDGLGKNEEMFALDREMIAQRG